MEDQSYAEKKYEFERLDLDSLLFSDAAIRIQVPRSSEN